MRPARPIRTTGADALFDVVLGEQRRRPPRKRWRAQAIAWLAALGVHLSLLVVASRTEPSLETWSARMAAVIHEDLAAQAPIAIEAPPAPQVQQPEPEPEAQPPEPAEPEPPPRIALRQRAPTKEPEAAAPAPEGQPAPPAEAGNIIAADAKGPVDLTDSTFVTGTASAYIGGATSARGTQRTPVPRAAVDLNAAPTEKPGRASRAQPVRLPAHEWRCDWPAAALDQDIYEQSVVLRVVVRADGSVERATLEDDPGHGFGKAAISCAMHTRFTPALDDDGQPVRTTSPPIRVRFTR